MIATFKSYVFNNHLFTSESKLLLALSGGADSVALFHLLRLLEFNFEVGHVNYGLRGTESDEDEQFVRDLCARYGITAWVKVIDPAFWETEVFNIQDKAREIRYDYFNLLEKENGYDKILTAHTKDDNLETVLMNFTRGTGLTGLTGIPRINGNIVRPVLCFEREKIESFLNEHQFAWRTDSSNRSLKYKRNRFRNEIIPLLKKENPGLLTAFDRFLENIYPIKYYFDKEIEIFKHQYVTYRNDSVNIAWKSKDEIRVFLFPILQEFGFNHRQVQSILSVLSQPGKTFESRKYKLFIDRNCILINKIEDDFSKTIIINEQTDEIAFPLKLKISISDRLKISKDDKIGEFDFDKLHFPLTLRAWRAGDKMLPLGMSGYKKVSDILIDNKIPLPEKSHVYVLESDGELVWLIGLVIGEKFKVDRDTQKVWRALIR